MHFTGTTSNSTTIDGPAFYSPGTYGSDGTGNPVLSSSFDYPIYNDVVGTFALLESPKINISEKLDDSFNAMKNFFLNYLQKSKLTVIIVLEMDLIIVMKIILDINLGQENIKFN